MNILIICGTLEAGKDGVGDYSLILTSELIKLGARVEILALNDVFVGRASETTVAYGGVTIPVSRIPAGASTGEKLGLLRRRITVFSPDVISLQFVPFAFHTKGLVHELVWICARVRRPGQQWAVTFHELWIEDTGPSPPKRLWAAAQRALIGGLIKTLGRPLLLTTNAAWASRLGRSDIQLLPLFGNVDIAPRKAERRDADGTSVLRVLLFGGLTYELDEFDEQLRFVKALADNDYGRVHFVFAGRQPEDLSAYTDIIRDNLPEAEVEVIGELSSVELSRLIQSVDLAISRAGARLFNKSGTTITMFEHGTPVLLRGQRQALRLTDPAWEKSAFFPEDRPPSELRRAAPKTVRAQVAKQFLDLISTTSP